MAAGGMGGWMVAECSAVKGRKGRTHQVLLQVGTREAIKALEDGNRSVGGR